MSHAKTINTSRLILVPATLEHLHAELSDRSKLPGLLEARVPDNWPPETLFDALPWFAERITEKPQSNGWFMWYYLLGHEDDEPSLLVGSGGFKGGPTHDGTVEIGYSILPQFQKRGFASEAAEALVSWAFAHSAVLSIIAETLADNKGSIKVLERLGFVFVGDGSEPGTICHVLTRDRFLT